MIIPSKEVLLITPTDSKDIFLFDPKTACVLHKYTTESAVASALAYYQQGQQFIIPHLNNTYVNVWETDAQEPKKYSVAEGQKITNLYVYEDSLLFMGSSGGYALIYELPSGILIRRIPLHSSQLIKMRMLPTGYLLSASKNQVKLWSLKDILAEGVKPIPEKSIHSATPILNFQLIRNIVCLLCENSVRFYFADCLSQAELSVEVPEIKNATCCCSSEDELLIGDSHGKIKILPVLPHLKQLAYDQRRMTVETNKKKTKEINGKDPITEIAFVESMQLIVSGNCKGQVKMWNKDGTLKNSLQLYKCSINCLQVIAKPQTTEKIPLSHKIKSLHKQQLMKLESPIFIKDQPQDKSQIDPSNQFYLSLMLNKLNDPTQLLQQQITTLKSENDKLLEASLHYAQIFDNMDQ